MRDINTFLVFKDTNAEEKELVIATAEEWNAILEKNRTLPREERRFFIENVIKESDYTDTMYIETTKEKYDKWHSQAVSQYEKDQYGKDFIFISTEQPSRDNPEITVGDTISDGFDLEASAVDSILMEELRVALQNWREWAVELFDYWRVGKYRTCSKELIQKYGISYVTIAKRKNRFEAFVKIFFSKGLRLREKNLRYRYAGINQISSTGG